MTSDDLDAVDDDTDKEFERVWEVADWMFKNDKQDAKYFFLKGRQVEMVKQQLKLDGMKAGEKR